MVKVLLESSVMCLAVIGLIELIKMLVIVFTDSKTECRCDMIVPVYAHDENIELLLRGLISIIEWDDRQKVKRLVCLDYGMDNETYSICSRVCKKYGFVHIFTPEEYCESINTQKSTLD